MDYCCTVIGCVCADPACGCGDCRIARKKVREERRKQRQREQRERNVSMNEELMFRILMFSGMVLAILAGCGALALLVVTAMDPSTGGVAGTVALAGSAVGFGWGGVYFGQRSSGHQRVFSNAAEREVLNVKQRRELRIARGSVVMQKALMEIDNERDKLIALQLEGPKDDEEVIKPEPIQKAPNWNRDAIDPYEYDDDRRRY